jgi:bifunctional non-homologous end joining protein LigD
MVHLADIKPMLLDERPLPLGDPDWIYELKFDGYRMLAEFGGGTAQLRTRNGADATAWFPEVVVSLSRVKGGPHICDGEVCVLDEHGRSDFNRLQDRARRRRWYVGADPVTYCVFDLMVENGKDLTQLPLTKRKALLMKRLVGLPSILRVGHFHADVAKQVFEVAVHQLKLEGLVAKRANSVYQSGVRSSDWVKVKRKGAVPPERFKREPK